MYRLVFSLHPPHCTPRLLDRRMSGAVSHACVITASPENYRLTFYLLILCKIPCCPDPHSTIPRSKGDENLPIWKGGRKGTKSFKTRVNKRMVFSYRRQFGKDADNHPVVNTGREEAREGKRMEEGKKRERRNEGHEITDP